MSEKENGAAATVDGSVQKATVDLIQSVYCPLVAVVCSASANAVCSSANNLSFIDLLLPFRQLDVEVTVKDAANQANQTSISNLSVDFRDMNADGFVSSNEQLSYCLSEAVRIVAATATNNESTAADCYSVYRSCVYEWLASGEHEFNRHFIACLLVASTADADPMKTFEQLAQQHNMNQHGDNRSGRWLLSNTLKYYVLLHDGSTASDEVAESVFTQLKMTHGAGACHLLRINSGRGETTALPDPWAACVHNKYRGLKYDTAKQTTAIPEKEQLANGNVTFDLVTEADRDARESSAVSNGSSQAPSDPLPPPPVPSSHGLSLSIAGSEASLNTRGNSPAPAFSSETIPHALSSLSLEAVDLQQTPLGVVPNEDGSPAAEQPSGSQPLAPGASAGTALRPDTAYGRAMTAHDRDRVKTLVQEFVCTGLVPFVERQMKLLNDQVASRKGLHKSFMSGARKWLSGSSGNLPPLGAGAASASSHNASAAALPTAANSAAVNMGKIAYPSESVEMQLRRYADLAFMFRQYYLAYQIYQVLKRDFQSEQAWLYYAGVLEMSALCAFILGQATVGKQYPTHYLDNAINLYVNSNKPWLAVRATLSSCAILGALGQVNEAAQHCIRMTTGENDLASGLFLEQASKCLARLAQPRKAALHLVLAGHRYNKARQAHLCLSAYERALDTYRATKLRFALDHISHTIGQQSALLHKYDKAIHAFTQLFAHSVGACPQQGAQQHRQFLHNVSQLCAQQTVQLAVPRLLHNAVYTFSGGTPADWQAWMGDAARLDQADVKQTWQTLETAVAGNDALTFCWCPSTRGQHAGSSNEAAVELPVGQTLGVCVRLQNQLCLPLQLSHVTLRVCASTSSAAPSDADGEAPDFVADAAVCECFVLPSVTVPACSAANDSTCIYLSVCVKDEALVGKYIHLHSIQYVLTEAQNSETAVKLYCWQRLRVRGARLNATAKHKAGRLHAPDLRLTAACVRRDSALLRCTLATHQLHAYCASLTPVALSIHNAGASAVARVGCVAAPSHALCVTTATDNRPLAHTVVQSHLVWHLHSIEAGQSQEYRCWLKAPSVPGTHHVRIAIAYGAGNSVRVIRRVLELRCEPMVSVSARQLRPSAPVVVNVSNGALTEVCQLQVYRVAMISPDARLLPLTRLNEQHQLMSLSPDESVNVCVRQSAANDAAAATKTGAWFVPSAVQRECEAVHGGVLPWPPGQLLAAQLQKAAAPVHYVALLWKAALVQSDGSQQQLFGECWTQLLQSTGGRPNEPPTVRILPLPKHSVAAVDVGLLESIPLQLAAAPTVSHDFAPTSSFVRLPVQLQIGPIPPELHGACTATVQVDRSNAAPGALLWTGLSTHHVVLERSVCRVPLEALARAPGVYSLGSCIAVTLRHDGGSVGVVRRQPHPAYVTVRQTDM